jgi:hypothetical protein
MSDQIPAQLKTFIQKKLGNVSPRHVNRVIAQIASDELVSRRAAAMLLARKLGINFSRHATAEDRAEMRGHSVAHVPIDETPVSTPAVVREVVKPTVKPAKNNTLFVVHGRDTRLNEDTVTTEELTIWKQFPTAAFTLVSIGRSEDGEEYRLGSFDVGIQP